MPLAFHRRGGFYEAMHGEFNEAAILAIRRPHPNLWTYYVICSVAALPLAPILLLFHWFRYSTMRYQFTAEGVSMSWGILFRKQVLLNYARIQDIHLQSNLVERWLGLARVLVQTASGSVGAEMTIEGLKEFEQVRDFLYSRMRGVKDLHAGQNDTATALPATLPVDRGELPTALREVASEIRALRRSLENQPARRQESSEAGNV